MDDFAKNDTVEVAIPVDEEAAKALADPRKREAMGRAVSLMLQNQVSQPSKEALLLLEALNALHEEVRKSGLTPEEVDAELAEWKAERRSS